jgi:predicted CoA-binding protein
MTIKDIFDNYKSIAVVGMSTNPSKPSHSVPAFIHGQGYNIFPVNPMAEEIIGLKSYKELMDIPENIDIVNVFRPSKDALTVVEKAVERKKAKGDVKLIWLQESIINDEAKALAEENGIEFIQDKCMYKEYVHSH